MAAAFLPWRGARGLAGGLAVVVVTLLVLAGLHAADLGLRIDRETIQRTLGGRLVTEHCDIYYDITAYTPERAAELAREHEFHYAELSAFFGFEPKRRIGSYVYASAAQKKRLMGAAGTSFEDAFNDEFHINASSYPHPVLRHEMAHIFAAHFDRWWKICPLIGVHEGIAVASDWRGESARYGLTPDEACVAMDSLGLLPDLRRSMSAFGFWSQSSRRVYTAAGSFVHYLIERYGIERFRMLWSERDFGMVYRRDLETLLSEWRTHRLDPITLTSMQMRRAEQLYRPPGIFSVPCAHERARLASQASFANLRWSLDEADSLYRELTEISGGEVQYRLQRTQVLMRARRFEPARAELLEILDRPDLHAALRGEALDRLGDASWQLGRLDDADAAYVLALEASATRARSRALHIARVVMADSTLAAPLRDYLTEVLPNEPGLAQLAHAMTTTSQSVVARYLMGRRLYFAGQFDAAIEMLADLPGHEDLPEDARLAALELLARAQIRSGRHDAVATTLSTLDAFRLEKAEELLLEDIAARAAWARRRGPMAQSR